MVILENAYKVIVTCPSCGDTHCFYVDESDYHAWECGCLIQNAFPYLTAGQRELLSGGVCEECWDKMFNPDKAEECEVPEIDFATCTDEEFSKFLKELEEYLK